MKVFLIAIVACLYGVTSHAQDSLVKWTAATQLDWKCFSGTPKENSLYDAEAFAEVQYRYTFYNSHRFNFNVYATFNRNTSWSKPARQTRELLNHEQMHFNIAELYARKLKEQFEKYHYTENFQEEIESIFDSVKEEYHLTQQRYDDDTNHSLNKARQQQWENFIDAELAKTSYKIANTQQERTAKNR